MPATEVLLSLAQARAMLAQMSSGKVDRAKWRRYRQAATIPVDKRFFDAYDMGKLAFICARHQRGDTLKGASAALWKIIDPIDDGPDYERRAAAAVQAELDRLRE
jgi:hypothetical protein